MACFVHHNFFFGHLNNVKIATRVTPSCTTQATRSQYLPSPVTGAIPSKYFSSASRIAGSQSAATAWGGGGGAVWGGGGRGWNGGSHGWDSSGDRGEEDDGKTNWHKDLFAGIMYLARKYNDCLTGSPLLTKAISAGILVGFSDVLAQSLTSSPTDYARLARYALYGLVSIGPQGHFWFSFLERVVTVPGAYGVVVKVLIDQLAFSPLSTCLFFATMKMAEGWRPDRAMQFVRENFVETMRMSYRVWPLVNLLNFAIVPTPYRIVFISGVSVFWVTFLSLVSAGQQEGEGVESC